MPVLSKSRGYCLWVGVLFWPPNLALEAQRPGTCRAARSGAGDLGRLKRAVCFKTRFILWCATTSAYLKLLGHLGKLKHAVCFKTRLILWFNPHLGGLKVPASG